MTQYAVLLPGLEDGWRDASAEQRAQVYGRHEEFTRRLAARGHRVIGGAELAHSEGARSLRLRDGQTIITDGPYAETAEQLTGFYLVESDDLDGLADVCRMLADEVGGVEIRPCVPGPEDS